jgi:REP element-mobilizing transposase RayT
MARLARFVGPGLTLHVTQRGNGRMPTFLCAHDYALYRDLVADSCGAAGVELWARVLMPKHVHLIHVPDYEDGQAMLSANGLTAARSPPMSPTMRLAMRRRHRAHHRRTKRPGYLAQVSGMSIC